MTCAVRSCRIDSHRRPDLRFFSLPNHQDVKEEWLEILGIERLDYIRRIKVCELHFKPKDFCEGRKQLKGHAVPVLKLGTGKSDLIDSDDEFMEYKSDSDQEIIEIPNSKQTNGKIKTEETPTKTESNEEPSEGRRPSRRAAREAAKKIYNTVRNFMPKAGDDDVYTPPSTSQVSLSKVGYNTMGRSKRRPYIKIMPIEVDLVMECNEEILSPVQAEALLKSQLEYNMVMKTLRSLKASNAKIIFAKDPYTAVPSAPLTTTTTASVVPAKLANNPAIQITKTTLPA